VTWEWGYDSEEDRGDMKEATARALEFARKIFVKDAQNRVEDGGFGAC